MADPEGELGVMISRAVPKIPEVSLE